MGVVDKKHRGWVLSKGLFSVYIGVVASGGKNSSSLLAV